MPDRFPIEPPVEPMLAKIATELPAGDGWLFEPKWDGFRAIVFRDHDRFFIQSRDLKPLDRYFPELEAGLRDNLPERCVVDGEIVIATDHGLDFEALQMRLHPAASRVKKLAAETPASFVAFDLLADDGRDVRARAQAERRAALEKALARASGRIHLTPCSRERAQADEWFHRFEGAGFGGVRMPGAQSRWSAGKDLSWEPVRVERVCEVKYDHLQGDRFRHAAIFLRWRPDKVPAECRYDQLEVTPPAELAEIFGVRRA